MFRGIKNVSSKKSRNKIICYSIFQLFFRGQKNSGQDESQVTEEFNVTNTLELNQELENEPNLEYNYEEEEEEENEEQENGEVKKDETNKNNEEIKNEKEENNIINEKTEIKNEIKEDKKEDKKEENKEEDDDEHLGEKYMDEDIKDINNDKKDEINTNIENKKESIIEEIDTTVPKNNNNNENNDTQDQNKDNDNILVKSISPNTICHRLIPKGLDIDITKTACFKCYKIKTKSNIISFITGSKKVKIPYLIYLDENFYYMMKDKPVNQNNENLRRIGNRYDLTKISNFQTRKVDNDYEFAFEFMNEDYFDRMYKLLYFEEKEAEIFFDVFQQFTNNLGIDIPGNIMGMTDDDEKEDEEGEEEEDDVEAEEKEEVEGEEKEDEKEVKQVKEGDNENKENKEEKRNGNSDINNKEEIETNSTKEESKEIRDIEVINQ